MKRKPYIVDGIADIRDAVVAFALERCTYRQGCQRFGCVFFAWCPKASTTLDPDLSWILRVKARKAKNAADRARRAGR